MSDINKINDVVLDNIESINKGSLSGATHFNDYSLGEYLPAGLIVPFNDSVAPDGWDIYNIGSRLVVGAGSTYSVGTTGGSAAITLSSSQSSTNGGHTGPYDITGRTPDLLDPLYATPFQYDLWDGDHYHSIVSASTFNPLCNNVFFIKSNSAVGEFPINSIILSDGNFDPTGHTNILNNSRLLRNGGLGLFGDTSANFGISQAGGHTHTTLPLNVRDNVHGTGFGDDVTYGGNHSGSVSLSVSASIRRARLSAWTNAAQTISISPNIIAMWEDVTAPPGWKLCDGTDGAPDLRDSFISTVSGGSENVSPTGNNTVSVTGSGTMNHNATHTHFENVAGLTNIQTSNHMHRDLAWSHSHSYSVSETVSYLPLYYALSFIMKSEA